MAPGTQVPLTSPSNSSAKLSSGHLNKIDMEKPSMAQDEGNRNITGMKRQQTQTQSWSPEATKRGKRRDSGEGREANPGEATAAH